MTPFEKQDAIRLVVNAYIAKGCAEDAFKVAVSNGSWATEYHDKTLELIVDAFIKADKLDEALQVLEMMCGGGYGPVVPWIEATIHIRAAYKNKKDSSGIKRLDDIVKWHAWKLTEIYILLHINSKKAHQN